MLVITIGFRARLGLWRSQQHLQRGSSPSWRLQFHSAGLWGSRWSSLLYSRHVCLV